MRHIAIVISPASIGTIIHRHPVTSGCERCAWALPGASRCAFRLPTKIQDVLDTVFGGLQLVSCVPKCFSQPIQILDDVIARLATQFFNDLGAIFFDQYVAAVIAIESRLAQRLTVWPRRDG